MGCLRASGTVFLGGCTCRYCRRRYDFLYHLQNRRYALFQPGRQRTYGNRATGAFISLSADNGAGRGARICQEMVFAGCAADTDGGGCFPAE